MMFAARKTSAEQERLQTEFTPTALRPLNLFLFAVAGAGTALLARQGYRYWQDQRGRRSRWKSRSRHPQIARWENEGGEVPRVEALRRSVTH